MLPPIEQWASMRGEYVTSHRFAADTPEYRFWAPDLPELPVLKMDALYLPKEWVECYDVRQAEPATFRVRGHKQSLSLPRYRDEEISKQIQQARRDVDWYLVSVEFIDTEDPFYKISKIVYSHTEADAWLSQWCAGMRALMDRLIAGCVPMLKPEDGRYF